jgi:hypothetical protein
MDLFELIKEHYGRANLSAAVEQKAPPPELPSLGAALEMCIDEVSRLRLENRQHIAFFKKEVVDIINGNREIDKLKATHFSGLRNDPYHNSGCVQSWGYTSRCPTCRVLKYAEETRDELTKAQADLAEATKHLPRSNR